MKFVLIFYTTTILTWSAAELLNGSSAYSKIHDRSDNDNEETRLLRRYWNDQANIKRPHIDRKTGFDGRVRKINVEPNENGPGIRAYGLPRKHVEDNGLIERINLVESEINDDRSRNARVVEAYGMSKKQLDNNGEIERLPPLVIAKNEEPKEHSFGRIPRSISEENKGESNDLEAQNSKVFRPLFVYRQQVARKQQLRNQKDFYRPPSSQRDYKLWDRRNIVY
ncbi:PREDICTED: uncharacterized protein LOC107067671 [Polistes dominula]|uniref:Uncharacterized protein LOC107067671 n=1 Tax=Polistes dominula TaxID=743375 RepID=A0ABM1IF73_POLDO|nr:PREDICTED: uncharacterized protein LOC107067671 [Polistes dominula]